MTRSCYRTIPKKVQHLMSQVLYLTQTVDITFQSTFLYTSLNTQQLIEKSCGKLPKQV